jgi:hypothetical protein
MGLIVSFDDFTPAARYDSVPWETVQGWEAATATGTYTLIDTITLNPVDADPANPAARDFSTSNGTEDDQWYKIRFVDGNGDVSEYTEPIQNVQDDTYAVPYATTDELARILKIRNPSAEQTAAMLRVLTAAALEIDAELGRAGFFSSPYPPLVVEVNLRRAAELWKMQEVQFGIVGLGSEFGATRIARDTWDKYAFDLAPLKDSWGIA